MKKIICVYIVLGTIFNFHSLMAYPDSGKKDTYIKIETTYGNMIFRLYNETPFHRDNMIKLIKQGYYDGQLFHRVISQFMIQGGDPESVHAQPGQRLGSGGPEYTLPAEFNPALFHKKGVLAAARQGDRVNPEKRSAGSQFYIVQGRVYTRDELNMMVERGLHAPFTEEEINLYTNLGGTPHLDGSYTVFGEIVEGMEVIDQIASVETDTYDRPLKDIVFSISLLK